VVEPIGDERDGAARDDFANEDNAAAHFAAHYPTHIKAQVDLRKLRVADRPEANYADVLKTETDDADVGLAVVRVGFRAGRSEMGDDPRRDRKIEQ